MIADNVVSNLRHSTNLPNPLNDAALNQIYHELFPHRCTLKKHTGNPSSLSARDLQLIEVMKIQKPSTSYAEILDTLFDVGDLPTGSTLKTSVCNAVRNRLPSGPFTYKKITYVAQEQFSLTNMAYT